MQQAWTLDIIWWITAVELPVLAGLFLLIWRTRHEVFSGLESQHRQADGALEQLREQLAAYKLEVATTYASIPALKEAERRLTEHLVRIEMKLDGVAPRRGGGRS